MEELFKLAKGLNARYPKGNEPFQIVTRLAEECGEVASEVNLWEDSGIKRQKHGEPKKEAMAGEIKNVLSCAVQLALYYHVEAQLCESIGQSIERLQKENLL